MNRRNAPNFTVLLLLVLMVVLSLTSSVSGQQQPTRGGRVAPSGIESLSPAELNAVSSQAVTMADGRIQVIVTLEGDPAVFSFANAGGRANVAAANTAAKARRGEIFAQQAAFTNAAKAQFANLSVVSSSQYLVNTVTVAVQRGDVAGLAVLPGVKHVSPNRIIQREDTTSIPFIGAPAAWEGSAPAGAATGDGQVIAVIDTGIDYTHLHFGGPGDYSVVPDDTTLTGIPAGLFPATWSDVDGFAADGDPKVVGGWDFVGNIYDANDDGAVVDPDPNPLDCAVALGGGHGSHVSGTAAGWGVVEAATATTYAGPFDSTIFTGFPNITPALRIGPGVAPRAALLALRVFGCGGSTASSNVIEAIDAAAAGEVVDLHDYDGDTDITEIVATFPVADVINMSLGSGFGNGGADDPEGIAVNNAAAAGVNVVTSSGNSADIFFITGSPGTGNSTISVANSTDTSAVLQGAVTRTDGTGAPATYGAALAAFGPQDINVSGLTVILGVDSTAPVNDGCTPFTNAADIAGKVVLVDRGTCEFSQKGNNAFAAGAVGFLVANNSSSVPITMGNGTVVPIVSNYNLPSVMISLAHGTDLKANLPATINIVANLDTIVGAPDTPDKLVASSSRGPVRNDFDSFKPNLAAPGDTITSARAGTGDQIYVIGGTSMASPHVAGVMALLREVYPTWSVDELKSLAINTANNNVTTAGNVPYPPQRVGSGRVDVVDALSTEVIAYNEADPAGVSVSFGFPEILAGATLVATHDISVENKGADPVTYDVTYVPYSDMAGTNVAFTVSPSSITVAAGATETVTVTLTANPNVANVHANSDATLSLISSTRHRLTEESGLVLLSPTAGSTIPLRVPVYAAPRVHSNITATAPATFGATVGTELIPTAGTEVSTGATANDIVSLVTASELVVSDANEANTPDNADLQYFGITSDYQADDTDFGQTFFSFVTYGEWATLNEIAFEVFLDLDQDGEEEFIVTNGSSGGNLDQFAIVFIDVDGLFGSGPGAVFGYGNRPNGVNANLNTYVFLNNVVAFPMVTEDLSLSIGDLDPEFNYWVETYSNDLGDGGAIVDTVASKAAPLTFNPEAPAYSFNDLSGVYGGPVAGLPLWLDSDASDFPVDYNVAGLATLPQILVLHLHNNDTNPAQVLSVAVDDTVLFNLLTPADGTALTTPAAIEAVDSVTWEESAGASTYEFWLERPTLDPVALTDLTPDAGDDELECAADVCTLDVAGVFEILAVENGTYSWYVAAFNDAGEVPADNNPFTFTVSVPAPVAFSLTAPGSSDANAAPVITDTADVTAITWAASDASDYNFVLFKISDNTRIGVTLDLDLTAAADLDPLTCDATVCTLAVDASVQSLLTDGRYAWTVVADNGFATTEASNAPFYFTVNTGDIELLVNGGFETAGTANKFADQWVFKNQTGDKRKVDALQANSGEAFILFKGSVGENSALVQKVDLNPAYTNLGGLGTGDQIQASILADTALTNKMSVIVKVVYSDPTAGVNGNGKDKLVVSIVGPTADYQAFLGTLTLDGATTKVTYQISFKSASGKLWVDDASLLRLSTAGGGASFGRTGGDTIPLPESSVGGRGSK